MPAHDLDHSLSQLATSWDLLRRAHGPPGAEADIAREQVLTRYRGAAYRYLLRTVGDPATADDLAQEFAVELIRGGLRHADPGRGRFRDYARSALFHLVCRHRRRARK